MQWDYLGIIEGLTELAAAQYSVRETLVSALRLEFVALEKRKAKAAYFKI